MRRRPQAAAAGLGDESGNFSGPVGSTVGQQPFRDGQTVREEQERVLGLDAERRARSRCGRGRDLTAVDGGLWMVGLEDEPDRCAEICVMEVFGDAVVPGRSAAVGMGLHAFRDPR